MKPVQMAISAIVLSAAAAGGLMYYNQVYAFYDRVDAADFGQIELTSTITGLPEPILTNDFQAIDSDSSPIRFRACFSTPISLGTLTDTYEIYETAEPLNGPGWFDCYDARTVGEAIERGDMIAFLGTENIQYGIDRVVAFDQAGNGFVWDQINACGEAKFQGDPLPSGCEPAPEGGN